MKPQLLIVPALLLACVPMRAQVKGMDYPQSMIFDSGQSRGHFGVRFGVDVTSPSEDENTMVYKNGAGYILRVVYNQPLWKNLYIEPSLGFFFDTFRLKDMFDPDNLASSDYDASVSGAIHNYGFRGSMFVGYHFDFNYRVSIALYTGPRVSYGTYASQTWKEEVGESVTSYKVDLYRGDNGMKRWDLQWGIGVGINFLRHYHVDVSAGFAMTNLFRGQIYQGQILHRNNFSVQVGYNF